MQSLEQQRAERAWEFVSGLDVKSKLGSELENLPTLLAVNGLLVVLLRLRQEQAKMPIFEALEGWLRAPQSPVALAEKGDLPEELMKSNGVTLRHATREAMLFANWLKRWAQAYIEGPDLAGSNDGQAPEDEQVARAAEAEDADYS